MQTCEFMLIDVVVGASRSAEKLSIREVQRSTNQSLHYAGILSPRLVEAAVAGALPRGVGVATLHGLPAEWDRQHAALGLKF